MKAIVKAKPQEGLWMEERPIPKAKTGEILIKVKKASICGTDVHLYHWDAWAKKTLPLGSIIGHEFIGEIHALGEGVKSLEVGMRVSAEGHITCGRCIQCLTGKRVLCPNTIGIGVNRDGCFAEYVAVPQENVFVMSADIPDDIACIFDPFGNTVHTALSVPLIGKDVLVAGAGPIGLMSVAVAKKAGARSVVITDLNENRLEMAKKIGADRTVNIKTENLNEIKKEMNIEGFEVGLEMSGSPLALKELVQQVSHGGHIMVLGIVPAETIIDWHAVIFKMLTIKGIYGREIFQTWFLATKLLQSGLDLSSIITHHFAFEDFQKGFDAMLSGKSGKVILEWK